MTLVLFVLVLALVSGIIYWILKRERSKEKRRFNSLVEKVNAADEAESASNSDSETPAITEAIKVPEFTAQWRKQLEPLRKAIEQLGMTAVAALTARDELARIASRRDDRESTVRWSSNWPTSDDPESSRRILESQVGKVRDLEKTKVDENQAAEKRQASVEPAREAWEKLAAIIANLPAKELEDAPPEVRPLLSAAQQLRDFYRMQIKDIAESCMNFQPHLTEPEKPRYTIDKLGAKLEEFFEALVDAMVKEREAASTLDDCGRSISSHQNWTSETFRPEPAKPTEEEVVRFLKLYQVWSDQGLPLLREIDAKRQIVNTRMQALEEALQKVHRFRLPQIDVSNADSEVYALYTAGMTYVGKLEEAVSNRREKAKSYQEAKSDGTDEKPLTTAREDELAEQLWTLARKLGYAIAQKNIAAAKADANRHKGYFDEIRSPKPDSGAFDLETYLAAHADFLNKTAEREKEIELYNAQVEVLSTALAARREKIQDLAALLAEAVDSVQKEVGATCGDTMKGRIIFASRIADDYRGQEQKRSAVTGPRPFY